MILFLIIWLSIGLIVCIIHITGSKRIFNFPGHRNPPPPPEKTTKQFIDVCHRNASGLGVTKNPTKLIEEGIYKIEFIDFETIHLTKIE